MAEVRRVHSPLGDKRDVQPRFGISRLVRRRPKRFISLASTLPGRAGPQYLASLPEGQSVDAARAQIMDAVRAAFRPEFINRLDFDKIMSRNADSARHPDWV